MKPLLVALALAGFALPGQAEQRPLWEVGIGAVGLSLPDYRGADGERGYLYPFPYVVYRGEQFKVDDQGIRGIFFESDRVELDVSVHATPPVKSDRNRARQGMPDLDPTIEVGPALHITLARDRKIDYTYRVDLRLPVRAVIATDLSHADSAGYVFYPHLSLDLRPELFDRRWNVGFTAGPLYGSRKYHEYFYSVAPRFATAARPAFEAPGGYSGTVLLASFSRRFDRFWVGGFARYDTLQGAAFEASPLVKRARSFSAGLAFAWIFAESAQKVETED